MPDRHSDDAPSVLPTGGPHLPNSDIADGARLQRVRNTISTVIGTLEGWRFAALLSEDTAHQTEISDTIDRATAALVELDEPDIDPARVQELDDHYAALNRETPPVPSEAMERYTELMSNDGYAYGEHDYGNGS